MIGYKQTLEAIMVLDLIDRHFDSVCALLKYTDCYSIDTDELLTHAGVKK